MGRKQRPERKSWDSSRLAAVKDFRVEECSVLDEEFCQPDREFDEPCQQSSSPSASRAKLERFMPVGEQIQTTDTMVPPIGNRIWDSSHLQTMISNSAVCSWCKTGSLQILENPKGCYGWASKVSLVCTNPECRDREEAWENTSPTAPGGAAEVNRRAVIAFRLIGRGQSHAATFAAAMNLPAPVSTVPWAQHTSKWADASEELLTEEFQRAAASAKSRREITQDDNEHTPVEIPVSLDGSWLTRGKESRHGFVTAISADTGDVIDRHYMCSTCPACTHFQKTDHNEMESLTFNIRHQPDCLMNHTGSAASMEAAGAVELFGRSEEKNGVRLNPYIGDGDSSAFNKVVQSQPYGPEFEHKKEECVGHIQKRMGARLRRVIDKNKGKKLSDGKGLSGAGRLTLMRVDSMQCFYGIALRKHAGNPVEMSRATWAILWHYAEEANHEYCPEGSDSWCKYKVDHAQGTKTFIPPQNPLTPAIVEEIKPVFEALADVRLLQNIQLGATQNANESLHNVVWSLVPKEQHHAPSAVRLGIDLGILIFNRGRRSTIEGLFAKANMQFEAATSNILAKKDRKRMLIGDYKNHPEVKRARKECRQRKSAQLDAFRPEKDYSSGKFLGQGEISQKTVPVRKCRTCGEPKRNHPRTCTKLIL